MRQRLFLLLPGLALSAALAAAPACGTVIAVAPPAGTGGGTSSASGGAGGAGGGPAQSSSSGYVDPGCPDAGPPMTMYACDPFAQDCPPGQGCFIFTQNPSTPCGQEIYGASCSPAGSGKQGASCDGAGCAGGFTCVVSGSGNQCVELCMLQGNTSCPDGLVCQPIDVVGFGGCL